MRVTPFPSPTAARRGIRTGGTLTVLCIVLTQIVLMRHGHAGAAQSLVPVAFGASVLLITEGLRFRWVMRSLERRPRRRELREVDTYCAAGVDAPDRVVQRVFLTAGGPRLVYVGFANTAVVGGASVVIAWTSAVDVLDHVLSGVAALVLLVALGLLGRVAAGYAASIERLSHQEA